MRAGGVWLVVGVQASGKSTVADLLARQFERGVHIRGGQFYRWAVRGWVHVGDADRPDEIRPLLDLRYRLSRDAADSYAAAGFTVVVQDNVYGDDVVTWLAMAKARPRHLVVLRPSVDVVERRETARHAATGKTAYLPGALTAADLDEHLDATPRIGLWLDTSAMTADETVAAIAARQHEAVVDDALSSGGSDSLFRGNASRNP